jgi:hypothetical protein
MNSMHPEVMPAYMDCLKDEVQKFCESAGIHWSDMPDSVLPTLRKIARSRIRIQALDDYGALMRRLV